jgi:hypothetical protein
MPVSAVDPPATIFELASMSIAKNLVSDEVPPRTKGNPVYGQAAFAFKVN